MPSVALMRVVSLVARYVIIRAMGLRRSSRHG